jgi:bisphosphoglycerate-independent phosphoglycerate mutase (AlkP superfamily)
MNDVAAAVRQAWETEETPSGESMFDEYIPPLVMAGYNGVQAGDVILHTNYRQDRATQLTRAFVDKDYPGEAVKVPDVLYAGMTRYYDGFDNFLLMAAGKADTAPLLTVGKVISDAGLYQLRIAETQKFPHVTSFFNGCDMVCFVESCQVHTTDSAIFPMFPFLYKMYLILWYTLESGLHMFWCSCGSTFTASTQKKSDNN